jgi:hypothetical protein
MIVLVTSIGGRRPSAAGTVCEFHVNVRHPD